MQTHCAVGWGMASPEQTIVAFQRMRTAFDSYTGSPENPRVGPRPSQAHHGYEFRNLERVFEEFEAEAYSPMFGRLFDTVLLRLDSADADGNTVLPISTRGGAPCTCLLAEIVGRTLRCRDFHPILLRLLHFVARDPTLLRNVLQFGGFIKFYSSGTTQLDEMIAQGYFESLVYDSVFKYGSMELFTFLVQCDSDINHSAVCAAYVSYAEVLWRTQRTHGGSLVLLKMQHVVFHLGGDFLRLPLQDGLGGGDTGVLRAYLRHEHTFMLPRYRRKSVDIMIYLARVCPQALRPATGDDGGHHASILHLVASRPHAVLGGEDTQHQFERLCGVLMQYASLSDLTEKPDDRDRTVEDYARANGFNTILECIAKKRQKLAVCFALHPRLGSPVGCHIGTLDMSLISKILDDI